MENLSVNYYVKEDNDIIFLEWAASSDDLGVEFGNVALKYDNDILKIYAETMGKEFVKELLCKLVDDAELME